MRSFEWWDKVMSPMRRVWIGVAKRLGIRKNGLLKLRHEVRTCEYEDVQVMWEMLRMTEPELGRPPTKKQKRTLRKIFMWARHSPYLCHSF